MKRLVFLLLFLPFASIAQAPPSVLIKPVAVCENGKCEMSEADYLKLREFHRKRFAALLEASDRIEAIEGERDALAQQNAELTGKLMRFAGGCEAKKT